MTQYHVGINGNHDEACDFILLVSDVHCVNRMNIYLGKHKLCYNAIGLFRKLNQNIFSFTPSDFHCSSIVNPMEVIKHYETMC